MREVFQTGASNCIGGQMVRTVNSRRHSDDTRGIRRRGTGCGGQSHKLESTPRRKPARIDTPSPDVRHRKWLIAGADEDQKPLNLDQWYDVIFEIKDDKICFQIKDGFSFRGRFKETGEADRPIVAFCGTNGGTLLIDDVSVLEEVKKQVQ